MATVKVTGVLLRHKHLLWAVIAGSVLLRLTGVVVGDVPGTNKNNGIVPVANGNCIRASKVKKSVDLFHFLMCSNGDCDQVH